MIRGDSVKLSRDSVVPEPNSILTHTLLSSELVYLTPNLTLTTVSYNLTALTPTMEGSLA